MKPSIITAAIALFTAAAVASPAPVLDSLDLEDGVDAVDWDNFDVAGLTDGLFGKGKKGPFKFTSTYRVIATPRQVVNGTEKTGGLKGARSVFNLAINRNFNFICYNIKLTGFRGKYESPATTATHIHQGARGASGPPRIAFPNPTGKGKVRRSVGCMMGVKDTTTGKDTGRGFNVRQIERNPEDFYADVHSSLAVPGAVRGQVA